MFMFLVIFLSLFCLECMKMIRRKNLILHYSALVKHELQVTNCQLLVTSWKLKSTIWNSKAWLQIHEFKFTSYEFKSTSYEYKSTTCKLKSMSYDFRSMSYEFKSTSYELNTRVTSSNPRFQESFNEWKLMNNCNFPYFLRSKFDMSRGKSVSGSNDNIVFYFSTRYFYDYGFSRKQNNVSKY